MTPIFFFVAVEGGLQSFCTPEYVDLAVHLNICEKRRVELDPEAVCDQTTDRDWTVRPRQGGSQACSGVLGSHSECCPWHSTGLMCAWCACSLALLTRPVSPLPQWKCWSFDSWVWSALMAVWGKRVCARHVCELVCTFTSGVCGFLGG